MSVPSRIFLTSLTRRTSARGRFYVLSALVAAVSVVMFIPTAVADHGEEAGPVELGPDTTLPPKPEYPRLDSQLNQMVGQVGQAAPQDIAGEASLYQGTSVAVTVRLSGDATTTVEFLEQGGATVANTGTDYIEAYVPVTLLAALSQRPGVLRVETIVPPQPLVISQGTTVHGSSVWNARGFTGTGVKVGVIDLGFQGFAALMGTDLPSTVVARCYTAIGVFSALLSDCEDGNVHGTAVAEAIVDIAPDVTLYIANPSSFGDLQASAAWMVSEGVSVINQSLAWIWDGPGDGTSPSSDSAVSTVASTVDGGSVWVNSAGNSAQGNWYGGYKDADADGFIEFTLGTSEVNSVELSAGEKVTAQARWDDSWTAASRNFNLALYNSSLTLVAASINLQTGLSGQIPWERIVYTAPATGTYHLALFHESGTVPSWLQLEAFTGQDLSVSVAGNSIANPAESASPGMLAVGAANWATPTTIETFSSQGPTTDGRTKPDLVGVDRGDSVSYGGQRLPRHKPGLASCRGHGRPGA